MQTKPPARNEALIIIAIILILPLFAITGVAYGLIAGFVVLFPSLLVILTLTKSEKPGEETEKLSTIDKVIYLIIAILLATLITAVILRVN